MASAARAVLGFRGAGRYRSDVARLSGEQLEQLLSSVRSLTLRADGDVEESVFLEASEAARGLLFSFDLENGQDASAAAAAAVVDARVGVARERLAQRRSEQDLFFNYFSHVAALLSRAFGKQRGAGQLVAELRSSIRAMVRVEDCAPLMAHLCWQRFSWRAPAAGEAVAKALRLLEPVMLRVPCSKADVISLAGCVALEEMGGPLIAWRPGRRDEDENDCALDAEAHFSEQDKAALLWLGACAAPAMEDAKAVGGQPFPGSPQRRSQRYRHLFDTAFFDELLSHQSAGDGKEERSPALPEALRPWVELYSTDEARLAQDFSVAFNKLVEWKFQLHPGARGPARQPSAPATPPPTPPTPSAQLEHFTLPEALALFDFTAAQALPVTPAWREAATQETEAVLEQVRALSAGPSAGKPNLAIFRAPHPETPAGFRFDLSNPLDRCAAVLASQADRTLSKFKPSLVPKISEAAFYANYFSHLYQLRKALGERDQPAEIRVFVGSRNPVKVNACRRAFIRAFQGQNKRFVFEGVEAPSGVSDQPMGDDETRTGAMNRARFCRDRQAAALAAPAQNLATEYYVGIEGGLVESEAVEGQASAPLVCCAWIAVCSSQGLCNTSRTATFALPPALSSLVRKGIELGRADDIVHGKVNSKQKGGTVATLTNGAIDRTGYYLHACILALAPFANPTLHI